MLLRQLYMAHYEGRRFKRAYQVSLQFIALRVLVDVAHQDAARAAMALGLGEEAVGHLRLASRRGPASRRAFHLWTLGSTLMLLGRYAEAAQRLDRAARWATTDKVLYQAQAAVARLEMRQRVPAAKQLFAQLAQAPAGQGYGRFVLGSLAYRLGRREEARLYLEAFVRRVSSGRQAMALSLAGELERALSILREIQAR